MARLPVPGNDSGTWGNVLNDFLSVEHNTDGTLKASGSIASKVSKGELVFDVKDYGAAGNGTTDDFAAFQSAVNAALAAGGGTVYFPGGATYVLGSTLVVSNAKDITVAGASRESTIVLCTNGFISASNNSDRWTIRDLNVKSGTTTNTNDGIVVDYPRRWVIQHCRFDGFGGDSIRLQGGLQCHIAMNYFIAKDAANVNGNSGINIVTSSLSVPATTITTEKNYVGSGKTYGIRWFNASQSNSIGDIIENINPGVGLRLHQAGVTVVDLYTEANTGNAFEMFDSLGVVVGHLRDEPVVTWLNVAFADRHITRIGRNWINSGKALLFGGSTAQTDASVVPSIRTGTGTPEGAVTGVVGSLWLRSDGSTSTTLYRKETGSGNTGWVASGASSGQSANVQFFTANGTWTKPAGAVSVHVTLIAGGGGGGSGRRGAAGTVRCGGGGGGGGAVHFRQFDATQLASSLAITVATGGSGGAAVTTNDTNGNSGNGGGFTYFGGHFAAGQGGGGVGGSTSSGTGGSAGAGSSSASAGGNSSGSGGVGTASVAAAGGAGGGGGGGITSADSPSNGGAAATSYMGAGSTNNGGAAGIVDSTVPGTGTAATLNGSTGGAGGGGAASITTNAQAGGNAPNYGGGGGGGGASLNGNNSGAGGNGGPGCALVITYF